MKYCGVCGKELSDTSKFCMACGAKCIEKVNGEGQQIPVMQGVSQPQSALIANNVAVGRDLHAEADFQKKSKKESKKKKKSGGKGKVILVIVLLLVLVVVVAAGILAFRWYTSAEQQVLRAIDEGDYDEALAIIEEDETAQESRNLAEELEERITSIKTDFIEGKIEYATARMELEAIAKMNVEGVFDVLQEAQNYVNRLNESRTNFATAESFYNTGDYDEAIKLYQLVIEEDANYEIAKEKLTEAVNKYREETLVKAEEYASAELYSEAIVLLKKALLVIPGDTKITEQVRLYEKEYAEKKRTDALSTAAEYAANGDYLSALNFLADMIKDETTNAELTSAYNSYCELYVTQVISSVDEKVAAKDFDGALSLLNAALKELPENKSLKDKKAEVEAQKPVSITSLAAINIGGWGEWNSGSPMDPFGNDYSGACNYVVFYARYGSLNERYIEYRLYGSYSKLTGTIAPYTDSGDGNVSYLQVYADDELIYTTTNIGRKTDAIDFSVDVSGAEYVKFVMCTEYGASVILSDVQLWP